MSTDNPDLPGNPPPPEPPPGEPQKRSRVGGFALGTVLGISALFVVYVIVVFAVGPLSTRGPGIIAFLPIVAYVVAAVWVAVRPKTAAFGTGMLIGLGLWLLIGGGPCVSFLINSRR